jgi:hypothetical protein
MHPYLHSHQHTQVSLYYGYESNDRDFVNTTLISEISFNGIHCYDEFKDSEINERHFQKVRVIFYHAEKSSKSGYVVGSISNMKNDEIIVSIYASEKLMEYVGSYLTLENYDGIDGNRLSLNFSMLHIKKPTFMNAFGFRLHRYILGKLNPLLSDTKYKSDRLIYELMGICINSYPYDAIRQLEERMVQIKDTNKTKFLKYQKLLDEVKRDIETMKRR